MGSRAAQLHRWIMRCHLVSVLFACVGGFQPTTTSELQNAVNDYQSDPAGTTAAKGDISTWDTSLITDFSYLFYFATNFNADIGSWDTSQATTMQGMFGYCERFNQDISGWDTSKVTTMLHMFLNTQDFNQNIGGWDTSSVTNFGEMFRGNLAFNQDIGGWDVSQATSIDRMFAYTRDFNQYIGGWDITSLSTLIGVFEESTSFNQDLSGWDTSNIQWFHDIFKNSAAFNQYLGGWDTSSKTSCYGVFVGSPVTCVTPNLVGCGTTDICPATTGTSTTSTTTSSSTWSTTSTSTTSSTTPTTTTFTTTTTSTTTTSTATITSTTTTSTTTTTASTSSSTTSTTTVSTTTTFTSTTSSTTTPTTSTTTSTTPTTTSTTTISATTTSETTTWTATPTSSTTTTVSTTMTLTTTSTTVTMTTSTTRTSTSTTTFTTTARVSTTTATAVATVAAITNTSTTASTTTTATTTTSTSTMSTTSTFTSSSTSTVTSTWTATRAVLSATKWPAIFDRLAIQIEQPSPEQIRAAQTVQGEAFIEIAAQDTTPAVTKALANTETIFFLEFPVSNVTVVKLEDIEVSGEGYAEVTSPSSDVSVAIPLDSLTQDLRLEPDKSTILVLTEFPEEVFKKAAGTTRVIIAIGLALHDAFTGVPIEVRGLTKPIEFTVREPYAVGKRCVFFDEEKAQWSTAGVVTPEGQTAGEGMRCQTYHLSIFGILLPGFLTTFICSNLGIFSKEAIANLVRGKWFLTTAACFFWTVVAVLGAIFILGWRMDVHRSRTFVWNDEFFLVPSGGGNNEADQPSDTSDDSEEDLAVDGARVKSGRLTRAVAAVRCCPPCWKNSAFKEALDEIGANWFEHVAELRAIIEGVLKAMECSTLASRIGRRRVVFEVCHIAVSHMVLYSSRRLAAAEMALDAGLVAFVMDDKEFQEMLIAAHEEASKQKWSTQYSRHWSVHDDATEAWKSLLDTVSHQVRLHVYRHTCQELPRMACALYTAHNPLGSVFHFSPFMSCKMRAFFVWTEIISSIFTSTVFYTSQGGTQRRSLDAGTRELASNENGGDPCAVVDSKDDFLFISGRAVAVALFSAVVATIPLLVLDSIRTRGVRHMDYKGSPDWNKQLRAWAIQDWTMWTVGTIYLGFCHFFVVLFLANIDDNSITDWIVTTVLGVFYHCILIPTSLAVLMPLLAAASVRCFSAVAGMHRDDLVRGIHEHLHRKTNAMLPIMHI